MTNSNAEFISEISDKDSLALKNGSYITTSSLREIKSIETAPSFFSEFQEKRVQKYKVFIKELGYYDYCCQFGIPLNLSCSDFIKFQIVDNNGAFHNLFINLQMVWRVSGYWLTKELVDWAREKEDEIFQIIFYAMSDVCNFFSWTIRSALPLDAADLKDVTNSLILKDSLGTVLLVTSGSEFFIKTCEHTLRAFSVDYHKACLWLGSRIQLSIRFYLHFSKKCLKYSDYEALTKGDLLSLTQQWVSEKVVRLKGTAVCKGLRGNLWIQEVFLRMDERGVKMEFQADDWEKHDGNFDDVTLNGSIDSERESKIKIAGEGPDAVYLELVVGSTTVSFNDLCALQEGSLLELSSTLLPMTQIKVAGEVIFEGELVRMGDQVMVQITRKVD